jgi:Kef-type K+ transport system membrane component KefB
MSSHIIITICILLLIAYIFDLTSSKTRIPSVILLLLLGWGVKQITLLLGIPLPDLNPVLPGLGTVGLVLIVLEGSLELDLQRSKVSVITKSLFGALLPMKYRIRYCPAVSSHWRFILEQLSLTPFPLA